MKDIKILSSGVKQRVDAAIERAFECYVYKVAHGYYEPTVEIPMQLFVMKMIEEQLNETTILKNEKFIIDLERNIPLDTKRDEVDGIIDYYKDGQLKEEYLIEFKYKKEKDGGPNSCNIDAYVDVYELERQLKTNKYVKGCYFIFMTDDEKYTVPGSKASANRMVFPLHDTYVIETRTYEAQTPAAEEQLSKSGYSSLTFAKPHKIEYSRFKTTAGKDYWYLILKIK